MTAITTGPPGSPPRRITAALRAARRRHPVRGPRIVRRGGRRPAGPAFRIDRHRGMDRGRRARRLRRGALQRRPAGRHPPRRRRRAHRQRAFTAAVAVVLATGWLPLTALGVAADARVHRGHRWRSAGRSTSGCAGWRDPRMSRSGVAVGRGYGVDSGTGRTDIRTGKETPHDRCTQLPPRQGLDRLAAAPGDARRRRAQRAGRRRAADLRAGRSPSCRVPRPPSNTPSARCSSSSPPRSCGWHPGPRSAPRAWCWPSATCCSASRPSSWWSPTVWPLTTTGVVLVLGTGVYTLVMAELQYQGVRRI